MKRAALLALLVLACSEEPCSDGSKPKRGTYACVCANGLEVPDSECGSATTVVPEDDAGPGVPAAVELGALSATPAAQEGRTGAAGSSVYYRFVLEAPSMLRLDASSMQSWLSVRLFRDAEVIDENAPLYGVAPHPGSDQRLSVALPAGQFLIRVAGADPTASNLGFALSASAASYAPLEATPEPGPDKASAVDIGKPAAPGPAYGGYVGVLDAEDYYQFQLDASATVLVDGGDVLGGGVSVQLLEDAPVVNETMPFMAITPGSRGNQRMSVVLPAGRYFLRVVASEGTSGALYTLGVQAAAYAKESRPEPGPDKESALDLGALGSEPVVGTGYVGALDAEDYYALTVGAAGTLTVDATDLTGGRALVQLFDDVPVINESLPRYALAPYPGGDQRLSIVVPAGRYFVRVVPADAYSSTFYRLKLQLASYAQAEATPEAGPDKASAAELGTVGDVAVSFGGYVGVLDAEDYHRFTLASAAALILDTTRVLGGRLLVQLFDDAAIINESSPRYSLAPYPMGDQRLSTVLPAGVYYVRVVAADAASAALYTVTLGAAAYSHDESTPEPGPDKSSAHELGVLGAATEVAGYVGALDAEDYYRVVVEAPTTLRADVTALVGGRGFVQLFADAEIITETAPLAVVAPYPDGDQRLSLAVPAGTYFLRVISLDGVSSFLYTLAVSAAP